MQSDEVQIPKEFPSVPPSLFSLVGWYILHDLFLATHGELCNEKAKSMIVYLACLFIFSYGYPYHLDFLQNCAMGINWFLNILAWLFSDHSLSCLQVYEWNVFDYIIYCRIALSSALIKKIILCDASWPVYLKYDKNWKLKCVILIKEVSWIFEDFFFTSEMEFEPFWVKGLGGNLFLGKKFIF